MTPAELRRFVLAETTGGEELSLDGLLAELDQGWKRDAACRSSSVNMFPGKGEDTRPAKAVCRGCAVTEECLRYALDHGDRFGIWGGLSARERRQLRQDRREAA